MKIIIIMYGLICLIVLCVAIPAIAAFRILWVEIRAYEHESEILKKIKIKEIIQLKIDDVDFNVFIKVVREAKSYSLEDITKNIISPAQLDNYEQGRGTLLEKELLQIAAKLSIQESFIKGQSSSPFKRDCLVALLMGGIIGSWYIDLMLMFYNSFRLIFLFNSRGAENSKLLFAGKEGSYIPVYAVAVRAKIKNSGFVYLVFRNKFLTYALYSLSNMGMLFEQLSKTSVYKRKIRMEYSLVPLNPLLLDKLTKWEVDKEDIIPLFSQVEFFSYDGNDPIWKDYGVEHHIAENGIEFDKKNISLTDIEKLPKETIKKIGDTILANCEHYFILKDSKRC